MAPTMRVYPSMSSVDDSIVLFGGFNGSEWPSLQVKLCELACVPSVHALCSVAISSNSCIDIRTFSAIPKADSRLIMPVHCVEFL